MRYWIEGTYPGGGHPGVSRIYLYDQIGNDAQTGTSADRLVADLNAAHGQRVDLHLHSTGGAIEAGIKMFHAVRRHGGVDVYIDGDAKSAASVVAQGAVWRYIDRSAHIGIHRCSGALDGSPQARKVMRATLDVFDEQIAAIYAERTGRSVSYWLDRMDEQCLYTAEDAVRAGLADRVVGGVQVPLPVALHDEFAELRPVTHAGVTASATRRVIEFTPETHPGRELTMFGVA